MFKQFSAPVTITPNIIVGESKPLLIAGPCVIESLELCREVAATMQKVADKTGYNYIFKASFDKANRTAGGSFRGDGMEQGLQILQQIKAEFQIRQTDLLVAAGKTGIAVNVKKGQFMAPEDMAYAVEKVAATGNNNVLLTERGASFGYHNLVVDMRSLPIMRQFAPVIFDVTHSVQMPGGAGGKSGGKREFAPYLAKAAAAVGVDGFFIETHPNPEVALSDGPNMVPLAEMEALLATLMRVRQAI